MLAYVFITVYKNKFLFSTMELLTFFSKFTSLLVKNNCSQRVSLAPVVVAADVQRINTQSSSTVHKKRTRLFKMNNLIYE